MNLYRTTWLSPVGPLHLLADDDHLLCLAFDQNLEAILLRLNGSLARLEENPILTLACGELTEYFAGSRTTFTVPIAPKGTEFQLRAWEALRRIPYGTTVSYQAQAREVGTAGAVRATGSANGRNPIAIIVPCHRVVRSDGGIGGYAGGISVKVQLLELEACSRKS
ncbi:methylated-DNA--protein-cysteine methyltransferase [Geomonas limicola]|uniref:Methylated-DNA--protein-cysteine methyltransferase n=1 Tax=Geomonas limicola TaxID=2740186 RepID=A0A6V8N9Y4_9BACT|nr:methylated-DNA--[protein]-cysteine S-methyltransferase [Geomonas limicola]GFO69260.1 methylated-DNA--protein-cysteine methyltransferase [Geomonas limicola]